MLYGYKTYQTITQDTQNVATDCNCVGLENKGEVNIYMQTGDTVLEILPGEAVIYNCLFIDVLETTFYDKVFFEPLAPLNKIRKLFITREFISFEKPARKLENKHIND